MRKNIFRARQVAMMKPFLSPIEHAPKLPMCIRVQFSFIDFGGVFAFPYRQVYDFLCA